MNSIYLGQINKEITKGTIKAFENNATTLDGMSAILASIGNPDRDKEREQIEKSAVAIRALMVIAESLFCECEKEHEECKELKQEILKLKIFPPVSSVDNPNDH